MKILINFTDDEVEMLNGWRGQASDGAGENLSWTTPYWRYLSFDNKGIEVDETKKPFNRYKDETGILEDFCDRFIELINECLDWIDISELFYDMDKREDTKLGYKTANSIIEKLSGEKEHYDI